MATIHLIDGGIGSVGKSLFCRVLIQYCLDRGLPYHLAEADLSNPDVAQVYPSYVEEQDQQQTLYCTQVSFDHPDRPGYSPNTIFELAVKQPVIVNLPAQAFELVNNWIDQTEALTLSHQYGVTFCKWFLCNGRRDSVHLFMQSVDRLGTQVQHILVLNCYFRQDWSTVFSQLPLRHLIEQYQVPVISLPKLADKERDWLDTHQLPFSQARQARALNIFERQRIHTFLKAAYQAIEQTQLSSSL